MCFMLVSSHFSRPWFSILLPFASRWQHGNTLIFILSLPSSHTRSIWCKNNKQNKKLSTKGGWHPINLYFMGWFKRLLFDIDFFLKSDRRSSSSTTCFFSIKTKFHKIWFHFTGTLHLQLKQELNYIQIHSQCGGWGALVNISLASAWSRWKGSEMFRSDGKISYIDV